MFESLTLDASVIRFEVHLQLVFYDPSSETVGHVNSLMGVAHRGQQGTALDGTHRHCPETQNTGCNSDGKGLKI